MKNIRQQNVIVAAAHLRLKRVPAYSHESFPDSRSLSIFLGHFQHVRPIQRGHLRVRVVPRHGDAVHAVTGGNIQHLASFSLRHARQLGDERRGRTRAGRHGARKRNPHFIIGRLVVAFPSGGAAFLHRVG